MTIEKRIQKCEEICNDISKSSYEKLAALIHFVFLPWSSNPNNDIVNYDYIECPFCGQSFYPDSELEERHMMYIDYNEGNPSFNVITPCCGKQLYQANCWNGKKIILQENN